MGHLSGKKVLFVITKSNWGGAQAYVALLAERARAAGAEVVVAVGGTGLPGASHGALVDHLNAAGIRTVFVHALAYDISLVREYRAYRELLDIIRAEHPDVVHLNSSKAGGIGALAARVAKVPSIIFTAHGWAHREHRPLLARALIAGLSFLTATLCTDVIVVSERDYREGLRLCPKRKLHLIRNGIADFPILSREDARTALARMQNKLPVSRIWVLTIAELHTNKGIDVMLRAFKLLAEKYPNVSIVILGGGEEEKKLKELAEILGIADRVFFLGFVADARQYLQAGDLFLLPSRKEGLPFALLEAGYAGMAVIATETGGIPELITNKETGLLVTPEDTRGLATTLESLLNDPEARSRYSTALHQRVLDEYSESKMVDDTLSLY